MAKGSKSLAFRAGLAHMEDGRIKAKNIFAYWLDEIVIEGKIHGTIYIVDGTYEGSENLPKKLQRILVEQEKSDGDE